MRDEKIEVRRAFIAVLMNAFSGALSDFCSVSTSEVSLRLLQREAMARGLELIPRRELESIGQFLCEKRALILFRFNELAYLIWEASLVDRSSDVILPISSRQRGLGLSDDHHLVQLARACSKILRSSTFSAFLEMDILVNDWLGMREREEPPFHFSSVSLADSLVDAFNSPVFSGKLPNNCAAYFAIVFESHLICIPSFLEERRSLSIGVKE